MSGTFDPAAFYAQFPELSTVPSQQLAGYYNVVANGMIDNSACSVIPDQPPGAGVLSQAMMWATAHLAKLFATVNGQAPSGLVGRISSAAEGSVNVSTDLKIEAQSAQFWITTNYGLMVWQMLGPYRTALWVSGPVRNMNPLVPGLPVGWVR